MTVIARLIKKKTDDGFVEMKDDVPIGKEYEVRLETKQTIRGIHTPTCTLWSREMIQATDGGWLPTELLNITCPDCGGTGLWYSVHGKHNHEFAKDHPGRSKDDVVLYGCKTCKGA